MKEYVQQHKGKGCRQNISRKQRTNGAHSRQPVNTKARKQHERPIYSGSSARETKSGDHREATRVFNPVTPFDLVKWNARCSSYLLIKQTNPETAGKTGLFGEVFITTLISDFVVVPTRARTQPQELGGC